MHLGSKESSVFALTPGRLRNQIRNGGLHQLECSAISTCLSRTNMLITKSNIGHITRFSGAPCSPSKLGSMPQLFHRSSLSGCFVAAKEGHRCIHDTLVGGYSTALHCGAPRGAGSVAANCQCCLHCAWDRGI